MAKYYYLRRKDGSTIDVPEKHLAETLKKRPDWETVGMVDTDVVNTQSAIEPPKQETPKFVCPLCGFEAKNQLGLTSHKKAHAKDNS